MYDFDPNDYAGEAEALDAYHGCLHGLDTEALHFALRNGYVPTSHDALIEAGMRCLPLISNCVDEEPGESALARMESIMMRLWPHRQDKATALVLRDWERFIKREKRTARNNVALGCMVLIAGGGSVVAVLWLLASAF